MFDEQGNTPYDATGCTANFAISDYVNQGFSNPYISKNGLVIKSNVYITLDAEETARLPQGKFLYQLTLKDRFGNIEIPEKGFVLVRPNINPGESGSSESDSIIHF